jgi:hypothetical protein
LRLFENVFLAATVVAACVGWGRAVERGINRLGDGPALPRLSTGVIACVGLAASLCASGVFVALNVYDEWIGWIWLAAGLILAVIAFAPTAASRAAIGLNAVAVGLIALVSLYMGVRALGAAPWNSCDDFVGYLPLGDRLLETGGMIEPFSLRRVSGFGGATVLDSIFTSTLGRSDAFVMDLVFGVQLLGLLLVPFSAKPVRLVLGGLVLLSIPFWPTLHWNLSPIFLIVALMAAALLVPYETRRTRADLLEPRVLCLIGILGAGLLTMRFSPGVPLVALGVALVLSATGAGARERLRGLVTFGGVVFIALVPWMLALWRSSGTPLYPPFDGNVNTASTAFRDPAADLWPRVRQVGEQLEVTQVLVGILVAGVVLIAVRRRAVWARMPLLALPGVLLGMLLMVASLSSFSAFDLGRAAWPIVGGTFVAALILLANEATAIMRVGGKVAAIVVIALVAIMLRSTSNTDYRFTYDTDALSQLVHGDLPDYEPWLDTEPDYVAAQAAIPAGAKVATSTDFPSLFDYGRNDVVNLDIVGAVSPSPGIPIGGDAEQMTAYLRDQGFDFVVLTDSADSLCLWNREKLLANLESRDRHLLWSRDILDWLDWARARAESAPALATRNGSLLTLDLRTG